ncbi:methyltransferase type 12 [Massilia eurypsychrophila]|jgi:SAM-dependent methyltransferase|uniref:Methyltransferase type 12 n=1 Tax=Massilia eurypsychrophila TaxID=1485217 RepID=A0A2G8TH59_9BURK|nr:class I SAM-dependent methyltransferase [Massilia eurypsychrophila]PIL45390.1 methyltransferase type 12 [Massilia eurypsychrophila]
MPNLLCPACSSGAVIAAESIASADLVAGYRDKGIDVAACLAATPAIVLFRCAGCDLGFFSPPCAGDAAFYEQLQQFDWYYQDDKPEYAYASGHVEEGARVLEVGCGKGAFHAALPASVSYTGLEFNDAAVARAQAAGLAVSKQPVEAHAAANPGRYDVVCSFQVLEHVPEPASFVHACVQALAPGGRLILAVPAEDSFLAIAPNAPLNMPPHHVLRWSDLALANLARREGLALVDVWHEPVASFHSEWHRQTLAFHYFVLCGLARTRLLDRGLRYRAIGRLLRFKGLRDALAASVLRRLPELDRGHTVAMVARHEQTAL